MSARSKEGHDTRARLDRGFGSASRLRAGAADGRSIRLVLVEDSDDDALLVLYELQRAGYAPVVVRVGDSQGFRDALETSPDLIISDHTIPGYGGLAALAELKASGKDIPFILVSGTVGETVAVSAMRAGAQDYVLKGDLTRLPAAVERELRDAEARAEQERIRRHLMISERMVSVGTVAASVAHEINNPLAVAMGNLDLAREALTAKPRTGDEPQTAADGAIEEFLREADEALMRIRDIVRDVKLFSRPQEDVIAAVDVRTVIDSSVRMAWNALRNRAELVRDCSEATLVKANESRLGQVLLNLIVNAAQALPEDRVSGNVVRIATRRKSDGRAVIEVTDNGCGIPPENLERIFDPFFTTKPVGVGTGLGLAICHKIVSEFGGAMEVESEVGRGTTFKVILVPWAEPDRAPARPSALSDRR